MTTPQPWILPWYLPVVERGTRGYGDGADGELYRWANDYEPPNYDPTDYSFGHGHGDLDDFDTRDFAEGYGCGEPFVIGDSGYGGETLSLAIPFEGQDLP